MISTFATQYVDIMGNCGEYRQFPIVGSLIDSCPVVIHSPHELAPSSRAFEGVRRWRAVTVVGALLWCCGLAFGQVPAQVPGAGIILQTVPKAPVRPETDLRLDEGLPLRAIADVEGMRIDIAGFRIRGVTVVPEAELTAALEPFIGPGKRFQDLLDAAAEVKRELAARGYFLADVIVPEQKVTGGMVELQVLEGRLGKVRLEVAPDVSINRSLLESYVSSLVEGDLIRTGDVERALFLIHDLRGIIARSSFSPGAALGTSDLTIQVTAGKAIDANLDFDANGSFFTGIYRYGGGIDISNGLGQGDLISLRASSAIDGVLRYQRVSVLVPAGPWGTKFGAAYSTLDYGLGTSVFEPLKASGDATVSTLIAIHPFIRSRNTNLLAIFQQDHRRFNDVQLTTAFESRKKTTVDTLGLSGDLRDRLFGGGINVFNAAYTLGHLRFGTPAMLAADAANHDTQGRYAKTNVSLSRLQAIDDQIALYGAFSQQFSNQNLDPSEKISLGGPYGVRAYPVGEGVGDYGYFGTGELRYRVASEDTPGNLVLTGFYDFGKARLVHTPSAADIAAGTPLWRRIAGGGVGLNWEVANDWYVRSSLAWRSTSHATADNLKRAPLIYFQASKFF